MAEYHLDVHGSINLSDYSSINDCMELVNRNDKFTISIEKGDKGNVDIICAMLKSNKFNVTETDKNKNGKYYIEAFKNK